MDIKKNGARSSSVAPAEYFVGTVRFDPVVAAPAPSRVQAARVTFEPGARTNWHTHPFGQTIHILSGKGLVQTWGGDIQEINPGDMVWFDAGEKHWHGASPNVHMCHLAIQEADDAGKAADWLEPVTDEQYID